MVHVQSQNFWKKIFSFFCKNDSFYQLRQGYRDTIYIWKSYPLLKLWQFGRWTKHTKITKFCSLKWHHRISKIHTAQTYFSRRFKVLNLLLPSLLGNGRIIIYYIFPAVLRIFFSIFSKFKPYGRRGRSQLKISHIPWLEHIPMEHLWEKSRQIHCKTKKKMILRSPREKKSNIKPFFDIFGLVRDVR